MVRFSLLNRAVQKHNFRITTGSVSKLCFDITTFDLARKAHFPWFSRNAFLFWCGVSAKTAKGHGKTSRKLRLMQYTKIHAERQGLAAKKGISTQQTFCWTASSAKPATPVTLPA
jgi:hypothetical protein